MRKLLKNLFSLWMAWAIALAPLQAFSAMPAAADSEACAMHAAAAAHQQPGVHPGHHGVILKPCADCPHCNQHDCDSDECTSGSCSGMHLQPAVLGSPAAELLRAAALADGLPASAIASRTDPPPLPPPV